jgi:hypothetical protein
VIVWIFWGSDSPRGNKCSLGRSVAFGVAFDRYKGNRDGRRLSSKSTGGCMHIDLDHCDIEPADECPECLEAVLQDGFTLQGVPEQRRTPKLCKIAVQSCPSVFPWVPMVLMTDELCSVAIQHDGALLFHVPEDRMSQDLCELAVRGTGYALSLVPDGYRTAEICEIAVRSAGISLEHVPTRHLSKEICEIAVRQDGMALEFVPLEHRSASMCEIACKNNCLAEPHVPLRCPCCNANLLPNSLTPIWKRKT